MATKSSGTSPNQRRKYDEAFKAEVLRFANHVFEPVRRAHQ